jgi:NhaP-type Na+/H+ or K+/H+ antiporter
VDKYSYEMWTSTRAKGKLRYILKTGILRFSLPFGIIMAAFLAITYASGLSRILTLSFFMENIAAAFIIIILMGIPVGLLYGAFSWWFKERDYRRSKR